MVSESCSDDSSDKDSLAEDSSVNDTDSRSWTTNVHCVVNDASTDDNKSKLTSSPPASVEIPTDLPPLIPVSESDDDSDDDQPPAASSSVDTPTPRPWINNFQSTPHTDTGVPPPVLSSDDESEYTDMSGLEDPTDYKDYSSSDYDWIDSSDDDDAPLDDVERVIHT